MNKKLIIVGAGENASVIASVFKKNYHEIYYLDDKKTGENFLGTISDFRKFLKQYIFFISIGNIQKREKIFTMMNVEHAEFTNAIHRTAVIEENVDLGKNVFIGALSYINTGTTIGDNVFINNGCIIEHDNSIGRSSHLTPGVTTGGGVRIDKGVFVGLRAVINDHKSIGEYSIIGSGSVVTKDIPPLVTAVGAPAKIIK